MEMRVDVFNVGSSMRPMQQSPLNVDACNQDNTRTFGSNHIHFKGSLVALGFSKRLPSKRCGSTHAARLLRQEIQSKGYRVIRGTAWDRRSTVIANQSEATPSACHGGLDLSALRLEE